MPACFKRVALMGRYSTRSTRDVLERLVFFLEKKQVTVFLEADTALAVPHLPLPTLSCLELGQTVDLVIVVGGDGSLLRAAHAVVEYGTPLIGVNRGHLGFLTDLPSEQFETSLGQILQGDYIEESRFLLASYLCIENRVEPIGTALNDVVLYAGEIARMIEFELYIDNHFVCSQRSDGLIIATPTGSTAYALSAGGPILHPSLESIVLVPMFPHTLSSRPIVVHSDASIELRIAQFQTNKHPAVSCDGQSLVILNPGAHLRIERKKEAVRLIHPVEYDYYHTLRSKLQWGSPLKIQ